MTVWRRGFVCLSSVAVLASGACSDDTGTSGTGASGGGAAAGGGGADVCASEAPPPVPSDDACARMPGGLPAVGSTGVAISGVHSLVRFFGPLESMEQADQALVAGLASGAALASGDLADYAAALPGVLCAKGAVEGAPGLGPATVTLRGPIAWVIPGTGPVAVPAEATAVVVDLRGLPDVDGLRAALEAAVGPALSAPVVRPDLLVRTHYGLTDEVFAANNVYSNDTSSLAGQAIAGTGGADLALGLATDSVMPPEAAALAVALRAAGRAFLIGEDVRADVAESRWQPVSAGGAYVRTGELRLGGTPLPDVIAADRRSDTPECVAEEVLSAGLPAGVPSGAASRPTFLPLDPYQQSQPVGETLAEAQAALLIAHGAARRFFPYFDVVGDTIDDRLDETLGSLSEPLTRRDIRSALRRFGEALHDGHVFVFDHAPIPAAGYLPVFIEDVDGEPVVRRSQAAGVDAGDTITSIDGVSMVDWLATELARTSAATPGYQFDLAMRELIRLDGVVSLGLRDADGVPRVIDFTPQPIDDLLDVGFAPSLRPSGFLTDLGAPALYYLNLDADALKTEAAFSSAMVAAQTASGLVVDMRGYPGINIYGVAARLVQGDFSSPVFRVTEHAGPDQITVDEASYPLAPVNPFVGPIVLLVSHHSVSAAENFATMLVDAGAVTVMGRTSAGTNGNITGVQLPGAFELSFTGMDVRHADATQSVFHGVGIVPVTEAVLSATDFRDGVDPELVEAVSFLLAP